MRLFVGDFIVLLFAPSGLSLVSAVLLALFFIGVDGGGYDCWFVFLIFAIEFEGVAGNRACFSATDGSRR